MKHLPVFFLLAVFLSSCQTSRLPLDMGIQTGYEAINPALILAVPVFVLPDPSRLDAQIDPSLIISEQLVKKIQEKVMLSFKDQPNVNGYSFLAVERALAATKNEEGLKVLPQLEADLRTVASRFSSSRSSERAFITSSCLARENFLEFYSYCLADNSDWIAELNQLSRFVMNADAALLIVITEADTQLREKKQPGIKLGVSALLVDTNNGRLMWGREKHVLFLSEQTDSETFSNWQAAVDSIFLPSFWSGFPGRIAPS